MCASSTLLRRKSRRKDACSEVIITPPIRFLYLCVYWRPARSDSTICSTTLSGTPIVDRSAAPRIVLTIPSAWSSMRFALSMISGACDCLLILRAAAMISKTAKGLTPAVSAKPLADDRDERFMVVLLHNSPGVIAEMTGVSTLLNPFVFVAVPFSPTTPQVQPFLRTPPLATARGRRPVHGDLLLGEFLETRTAGPIADWGAGGADCGLRIASFVRFSIFGLRSSILQPRGNLGRGV